MNKNNVVVLAVIAVLIVGGIGLFAWHTMEEAEQTQPTDQAPPTTDDDTGVGSGGETGLKTYTQTGIFTIQYPSDWRVERGSGLGGSFLDNSLAKFTSPEGAFSSSGTNFGDASVVISMSSKTDTCTLFSDIPNATSTSDDTVTINGVIYQVRTIADAAAGNRYDSRVYRMSYAGYCGEATLMVHTGNIDNYPSNIKEFDKTIAFDALENILKTLHFTGM